MPLATNQAWSHRRAPMIRVISAFQGPIRALEIGTWFGEGSTALWLEYLKPGSSLTLLDAWRPYASSADIQASGGFWSAMNNATTDAFLSTFVNCRRHEITAAEKKLEINIVRAPSTSFLPLLASDLFDFVYVDGDHTYESVKSDIHHAKRLIRKRGAAIICGDDLEFLPTPQLIGKARQHLDRDYVEGFHPGVLLAVAESFENVEMENGFWYTVIRDGVFGVK